MIHIWRSIYFSKGLVKNHQLENAKRPHWADDDEVMIVSSEIFFLTSEVEDLPKMALWGLQTNES